MSFKPTPQQTAIYEAVAGKKNVAVSAVAGSGKTSTAVEAVKHCKGSVIFTAFNNHIVAELKDRLGAKAEARTMHSLGFALIREHWKSPGKPNGYKSQNIFEKLFPDCFKKKGERAYIKNEWEAVLPSVETCRTQLYEPGSDSDWESILESVADQGKEIGDEKKTREFVTAILTESRDSREHGIDFTDMIYLPVYHGWAKSQADTMFLDEAQDLNPCQHRLALNSSDRHAIVGDPRQAIMAFAGASSDSFGILIKQLKARKAGIANKPLTVCWRCPASGIELANILVPEIQPAPNAIPGEVLEYRLGDERWLQRVDRNHLVICRRNAPLLSIAFQLLKADMPVLVRGKNIGEGLKALVNKMSKYGSASVNEMLSNLDEWKEKEAEKMRKWRNVDDALQGLEDRVDCIRYLSSELHRSSEVVARIERLFSDETANGKVILSSIHRSKGLEADHVHMIDPGLMPRGRNPADFGQDVNLLYVGLTRHKKTLALIDRSVERKMDTETWLRKAAAPLVDDGEGDD